MRTARSRACSRRQPRPGGAAEILASGVGGTLYTGATNDVARRVSEQRDKIARSLTARHDVTHLVYFEHHTDVEAAIRREKQITLETGLEDQAHRRA